MANILVLDDVADAAMLVQRILTKKGHHVVRFSEEEDVFSHAGAYQIDLAILDIKLKKLSGVQVLAELKKIQPKMKAIMLTGYPTIESAREAIDLGVGAYCVKPIDKRELEEKVAEVLG